MSKHVNDPYRSASVRLDVHHILYGLDVKAICTNEAPESTSSQSASICATAYTQTITSMMLKQSVAM